MRTNFRLVAAVLAAVLATGTVASAQTRSATFSVPSLPSNNLAFSGNLDIAGNLLPVEEQGPGGLASLWSGPVNVTFDFAAETFSFTGGASLDASTSGSWQPGPGGAIGVFAPADYGVQIVLIEPPDPPIATIFVAARDVAANVSSAPIPFVGDTGAFTYNANSTATLLITAGTGDYDTTLLGTGTISLANLSAPNASVTPGNIVADPGNAGWSISLPTGLAINTLISTDITLNLTFAGTLVSNTATQLNINASVWRSTTGGDSSDPANWAGDGVPDATKIAAIYADQAGVITYDSNLASEALIVNAQAFVDLGGGFTHTVSGPTIVGQANPGSLVIGNGFLITGQLNVGGSATAAGAGGLMDINPNTNVSVGGGGVNIQAPGSLIVSVGSTLNSLGGLQNRGQFAVAGNAIFGFGVANLPGATIAVNAGGALDAGTGLDNRGTLIVETTGSVIGNVNVHTGGVLSPGASPGTAAITGDLTFGPAGSLLFEINDATGTSGGDPGWDLANVVFNLNITATNLNRFTIDVTTLAGAVPGQMVNWDPTVDQTFVFANAGAINGFDPTLFAIDLSGFQNPLNGGVFNVVQFGNNSLALQFTALVPEPGSFVLVGVAATGLIVWQRRRLAKRSA